MFKNYKGFLWQRGDSSLAVMFVIFLVAILVLNFMPAINTTNVDSAQSMLKQRGFTVLSAAEENAILALLNSNSLKLDDIKTAALSASIAANNAVIAAQNAVNQVNMFNSGVVSIFPASTANVITLIAGNDPNTFSAWTELKDSANNSFSGVFSVTAGYLDDIYIYGLDVDTQSNSSWLLELSYGASKTNLARIEWHVDTYASNIDASQIKSRLCPAGQTIYYRLMCTEGGGSGCLASLRYFYAV